jgi:hypothetical protein
LLEVGKSKIALANADEGKIAPNVACFLDGAALDEIELSAQVQAILNTAMDCHEHVEVPFSCEWYPLRPEELNR